MSPYCTSDTSELSQHTGIYVLQCVLQYVAVCCSVLQCVAVHIRPIRITPTDTHMQRQDNEFFVCYSVLQCVAVCCSVLRVAVCYTMSEIELWNGMMGWFL